eukprot:TRINITY_DN3967_c0_g1_i1.p2 TRINITY_DN3967_c0_g1~~TRINITY_DN3967_c0_g1_i1.p2  ORF type:complete len:152 (-),score=23.28 TRINITY_DN3967_c0_g1_i1:469-924(-)
MMQHWGSDLQLRTGLALATHLYQSRFTPVGSNLDAHKTMEKELHQVKMDPAIACLLVPAGGILGPGSGLIAAGVQGALYSNYEAPLSYHGAAHDAAGYSCYYHGVPPGYRYAEKDRSFLDTYAWFGHWSGWRYFVHRLDSEAYKRQAESKL